METDLSTRWSSISAKTIGRLGVGARIGRRPAPGTQKEAGALVEAWVKTGAVCPN